MRQLKKIRETNAGPMTFIGFTNLLYVSFEFFFFTNADCAKIKMRHLNKICETNGCKIREQDVPLT